MPRLKTDLTDLLGIQHPIILAGMNKAAGPKLAAAVSNSGGLGVIGGNRMSPRILRMNIANLKKNLDNPSLPFGVDLLIPKIGGGARATNTDYNNGKLDELIDIMLESPNFKLFVCAIGVPPVSVVKKLHDRGVLVMNMCGAPKHVHYACKVGVDMVCAQGGEGGGHTGDIATSILLPECVDIANKYKSPLTGKPVMVIGAGGIYDGRGLAMALSFGCQGVWVGTRFVACEESGAPINHKKAVIAAGYTDTIRTEIYSGRPLRVVKNDYVREWHLPENQGKMRSLLKSGVVPMDKDGRDPDRKSKIEIPHLAGQVSGALTEILPARVIVDNMVQGAIESLQRMNGYIRAKL